MIGIDQFFGTALAFNTLALAGAIGTLLARFHCVATGRWRDWYAVVPVAALACAGTVAWRGLDVLLVVMAATGTAAALLARWRWPWLHLTGLLLLVARYSTVVAGTLWFVHYSLTVDVGQTTRVLLVAGIVVALPAVPYSLLAGFLPAQIFYRDTWSRPNRAYAPVLYRGPKVSIHVATYAEPPDVVIATLDALARLRYEDFEVVVVDNNTKDPALWRPVEEYCRLLGERFRFFHVDPLSGAKAGALNYALARTGPDVDLVALVDADYQMAPDFLARIVGHFDDPDLGFVQCRYDFRDWEHSFFLTGCYWGYLYAFPSFFRSLNELTAAFPMGTSCVLRREAVARVGGWAEWCVTEDSEMGVRLHAAGYTSLTFDEAHGHGLVPETFEAFKKQRFRWTYGPVQQLKRHWRLFLPRPFCKPSQLSPGQKLLHLMHGFDTVSKALGVLLVAPLGLAVLASMVVHGERPPVPSAMWFAMVVATVASWTMRWTQVRHVVGAPGRSFVAFNLLVSSLSYVCASASIAGLFTRSTAWRRTSKFKPATAGWRVVGSARPEILLGTLLAVTAATAISVDHTGLFLVLELAALRRSWVYFSAPVAALSAERTVRRDRRIAARRRHPAHLDRLRRPALA